MMARSDNAVAVLLQDLVGSGNINSSMQLLGLKNSHFLSEDLPTSAADLAKLLEGIGRGQAVSKSASEEMIRLLSLEQFDNGLRAGTPGGLRVAHKTGNYMGVTHDAGIVYGPSGAYVIVVLSDGENATAVTKDIATLVFDYFSASQPVAVATLRAR
jgi:beta-lactamase class A